MNDLISRQAALIKRFESALLEHKDGSIIQCSPEFVSIAVEILKELKAWQWIPCSERLPSEKDGQVLATKCGEVRIATYSEFSGTWYVGEMCAVGGEDPIAWMPLPEPHQEGEGK